MKWFFAAVCVIALLALIPVAMGFHFVGKEVSVRASTEAQQDNCKSHYDQVWKIIAQQAEVAAEYKDQFKDVYAKIMNERYSPGGGTLAKFIKEANPKFSDALLKKVANSIERERKVFHREQTKLRDLKREHDTLLRSPISGWFVKNFGRSDEIEVTILLSSRTNEAFDRGVDDDVKVFPKKEPSGKEPANK